MTFQRTFEVDTVCRVSGCTMTMMVLKEPHGDNPGCLRIDPVDEQLLHMLVVASPDGVVLSDDGASDDILCSTAVDARVCDYSSKEWQVVLAGTISGTLRVDAAAYSRLTEGTELYLRSGPPVAVPAQMPPGWEFALELSDAVQVPFQQVCKLGVLVGAAGGTLTAGRGDAMVFVGPGVAPPELQDWCRNNDVTCAVSAGA